MTGKKKAPALRGFSCHNIFIVSHFMELDNNLGTIACK